MSKEVLSSTADFDFFEINDITAVFLDSISIEDLITILRTKNFNENFRRGFLFSSAIHYYRNENTSEKKRHLLKIISEIPNDKGSSEIYPLLANCYWKIASYSILRDKDSFEEAITEALNAVSHFENKIDKCTALAYISKLYEKNGNNDQALKLLNDAIEIYSNLLNNPSVFQRAKSNHLLGKNFERLVNKFESRKEVLIKKIKENQTCTSKKIICIITVATLTIFLFSLYVFYPRR
jgi:tetratricopeptide (TPR) repeat protein